MDPAVILALGNIAIDAYEAYRTAGLTDVAAKDAAVKDLLARWESGDADLTAALAGKPVPTSGPSSPA